MLQLFRTNQYSVSILLLLYALVLKIGIFFQADTFDPIIVTGYLPELLLSLLPDTFLFQLLIGLFSVFLGGFMISVMVIKQRLQKELTLFSGVFFILIAAFAGNYLQPSGMVMGALFLIIALHSLLESPNKVHNSISLFNTGLFIGLASLFYWSLWIFIIWAILGVFQLLGARVRKALMMLTGFIVPFFYLGVEYFWNRHFFDIKEDLFSRFIDVFTFPLIPNSINEWIGGGVFLLLILISLGTYRKNIQKKQVIIRRKINIIYWMIPFVITAVVIQSNGQFGDLLLLAIPLSSLVAFWFNRLKPGIAEILHLILLAGAMYLAF